MINLVNLVKMAIVKIPIAPLKYQQVLAELVSTIQLGEYQIGDKLPSETDLAQTFGASRSTIIRALRGVEEQGLIERKQGSGSYVTRKGVRSPARTTVGLLKGAQSGRFPDSIVDQLQSRLSTLLQSRGSALIVHTIEKNDDPIAIARNLRDQRVGGAFLVPMVQQFSIETNRNIASVFTDAGAPVVLLDGDYVDFPHRSNLDVVAVENRHCGFVLTDHLLKLGLRRILYLSSLRPAATVGERIQGYQDAMRAHGVEPVEDWVCKVASDDITESYVADLLKRHRPEGLVCKSDEFAALVMRHLPRLGVRVPEDLKIAGFDDRSIASLLPVSLTTIRQPISEMAEVALRLMDDRRIRADRPATRIQLNGELIVRQSTGG